METIKQRIEEIKIEIEKASKVAGTNPDEIQIIAVTKTVSPETIQIAVNSGISILGENRVQEAQKKFDKVTGDIQWHLIGHLQRNKAKVAVQNFSLIQSLDSYRLAKEIEKAAQNLDLVAEVLVQINIGMEDTKYGIDPREAMDFISQVSELPHIRIKGLMTIPPFREDPEEVRTYFKQMKEIFDEIKNRNLPGVEMKYLSMGMSNDYHIAVEEGSNMVRIGTGIFGSRK